MIAINKNIIFSQRLMANPVEDDKSRMILWLPDIAVIRMDHM